jgi:ribonuclease HI
LRGSKRQRGIDVEANIEIVQLNANAWSGHVEWLEREAGKRTLVVCGQEHKLDIPALEAACVKARGMGWNCSASPAVCTGEGSDGRQRSAGTYVAVAKHVGSELLCEFGKPDLSPNEAPGRLTARWVNLLGGIVVFSLYLKDGVGWNDCNRELALQLLTAVNALRCPWIVAMDANMTPDEFLVNGSVQCMRGVIAAPKEGTCRFKENWKCYDFFYIDERLRDLVVKVEVLSWWHTYPHKPVRLVLRGSRGKLFRLMQVIPKQLPIQVPIGCARRPPAWPKLESAAVSQEKLDENYSAVMRCLEQEVLDKNDIIGDQADEYSGRGKPLLFRKVPLLPPRRRNTPTVSAATQHLKWMNAKLTELGHLLVRIGNTVATRAEAGGNEQRRVQLKAILVSLDQRTRWMHKEAHRLSEHPAARLLEVWFVRGRELVKMAQPELSFVFVEKVFHYAVAVGKCALAASGYDKKYNHDQAKIFYAKASEKAAGALHRVTKLARYVDPAPCGRQNTLTPDQIVETKHEDWSRIWQVDDMGAQGELRAWLDYQCTDEDALGDIDGATVDKAGKHFKESTSLKVDALHPRVIANASEEASEAVAQLLNQVEATESWPAQVALIVYSLLSKADGGDRPIGIPAGLVRLWERCRMPVMRKWLQGVHRNYDYAQEGCSTEDAVWMQLLEQEALPAGGGPQHQGIVTILTDVVKCFDRVRLNHVWKWGLHWAMPRKLLKMVLVTFSLTRRLLVQGAYSGELQTITSIVPGSVFAIGVLHCMLLHPCDVMVKRWPSPALRLTKYVDDISLATKGIGTQAAETAIAAFDWMRDFFRDELNLDISLNSSKKAGKTVALSSSTWLRKEAERSLSDRGISSVSLARNLGVDHKGAGPVAQRGKSSRTKRVAAALLRRGTLRKARRFGASTLKVATAGLIPAMRYGHKVLGSSKAIVIAMQKVVAEFLPGRQHGRSRHLRLAWHNCDPGPGAIAGPIVAWAAHVWDKTADAETLRKAWLRQQVRFASKPRWQLVEGPAGATRMQTASIGWKWPAWHTLRSKEGLLIDLRICCPQDVKAMAVRDAETVAWEGWTKAEDKRSLAPAPLTEPVQRWAKRHKFGPGPATAALAFTAGMWTQHKAHAKQIPGVESDSCLVCLKNGIVTPGTAQHRLAHCASTAEARQQLPRRWQYQVESSANRLLWDRGLVANPAHRYPFQAQSDEEHWQVADEESDLFTGDVATDGSRIGNWRELGRTGWAGVMLTKEGTQVALALWGPLRIDLPVQRTIARAELYAVWKVLQNCMPPVRLHVDCGLVVDGILKGRRWCEHSSRPHADIWKLVWRKLEDVGLSDEGVQVVKIAAHLSKAKKLALDPEQGKLHIANEKADQYAKQGADLGTNRFLAVIGQAVTNAAEKVTGALDYLAGCGKAVLERDGKWLDVTPPPRGIGDSVKQVEKDSVKLPKKHLFCGIIDGHPEWLQCGVCLKTVRGARELEVGMLTACVEHPAHRLCRGTLASHASANGHHLWSTGPHVWCALCGHHTERCRRKLATPCTGVVVAKWCLANLRAGRAPRARVAEAPVGRPVRLTVAGWVRWRFEKDENALKKHLESPDGLNEVLDAEGVEPLDTEAP